MAVMALIAISLSVMAPSFSKTIESAKLNADAQKIATVLKLARQEAITTGQSRTVVFYTNNAKYKISGQSFYYLNPGVAFVGITTFTTEVGGLRACGFSPSGAPSSGGTVTLSNGVNNRYIIVNPTAGRIRISESPPENWN
jgi:general secretion pathway protein H